MSEKRFCDVPGCGKELAGGYGFFHRKVTIDLGGLPVEVEVHGFAHHKDICTECGEKIPSLIAAVVPGLFCWECSDPHLFGYIT